MPPSKPTAVAWLTAGDVARAAGVTLRTVQKWCDSGLLRCERLPSGHRRIATTAWEGFKAGAPWAEQETLASVLERRSKLDRQIRAASSPQEVMALLRGD